MQGIHRQKSLVSQSTCSRALGRSCDDGPKVITYRDFQWAGHPRQSCTICNECRHLDRRPSGDSYCHHHVMIEQHGVPQFIGWTHPNNGRIEAKPFFCPVLIEQGRDWEKQPARDVLVDDSGRLLSPIPLRASAVFSKAGCKVDSIIFDEPHECDYLKTEN